MIRNSNTEDKDNDKSLMEELNETFLFGHTVRLNNWTIRAPIWFPPILYSLCTIGTIAKILTNYSELGLVIENCHMLIHMITGTQTSLIAMKNIKVVQLSQSLEEFVEVCGFEEESRKIKSDCEKDIRAIYSTYSRFLLFSTSVYILFPLGKLFSDNDSLRLDDLLVWPMRVGILEEYWWGFAVIFSLQMATCIFLILSVIFTVSYLVCLGKMTIGHCNNLCLALRTFKMKLNNISKMGPSSYDAFVSIEIDKYARQLDSIQKYASEVTDLFKYYLSSYYYGGAVVLCMSGIQAMVADKDQGRFLKFLGILAGELLALAATTDISEEMINAFVQVKLTIYDLPWYDFKKTHCQRLRLMVNMTDFRGLRTMFGYELTLAHFSDILNTAYRYYNLLYLMMKEKKLGNGKFAK